jgi:hypothetical protein
MVAWLAIRPQLKADGAPLSQNCNPTVMNGE